VESDAIEPTENGLLANFGRTSFGHEFRSTVSRGRSITPIQVDSWAEYDRLRSASQRNRRFPNAGA